MNCPDDDTYARFLEGLLPAEDQAQLEAHLDRCPGCSELLSELGKAYAEVGATRRSLGVSALQPRVAADESSSSRELLWIELLALFVHLLVTGKILWWAKSSPESFLLEPLPGVSFLSFPLSATAMTCLALSGPIGATAAAMGAWGIFCNRRWAATARHVHALLALPSVLLSPLALYLLTRYRR